MQCSNASASSLCTAGCAHIQSNRVLFAASPARSTQDDSMRRVTTPDDAMQSVGIETSHAQMSLAQTSLNSFEVAAVTARIAGDNSLKY